MYLVLQSVSGKDYTPALHRPSEELQHPLLATHSIKSSPCSFFIIIDNVN